MDVGTYSLLVYLPEDREILIGKTRRRFLAGYYVYVGSAMGGLDNRIRRHLSSEKKKRWHIDFLLEEGRVIGIERIHSGRRLECELNSKVSGAGGISVKGFGSSDCNCEGHLHYFRDKPEGIRLKVG